ncbi:endolytic transglycosylase MltG [candidate division KSB1 bacterium]|nr:MAG: endolytic transglycosylase MltG [candidate division KSB1 bacterium]
MRILQNLLTSIKLHRLLYAIFIVIFFAFLNVLYIFFYPTLTVSSLQKQAVTVKPGMSSFEIADMLVEKGVIRNKKRFIAAIKILGVSTKLQSGDYIFSGRLNNYSVTLKLYKGRVITQSITFPEGMKARDMAGLISRKFNVDSLDFMRLVKSDSVCKSYGIRAGSLEGYLYPDTYKFRKNVTASEIVDAMVKRWKELFTDSLRARAEEINLSVHQVMTLASIIEGEVQLDRERATVSSLYHNRLRIGMRLQADPTIQYIIKNGPRRLLEKDLKIDSPYNTYIYAGLPPGPINNPGVKSIIAALYPDSTKYLYMVANGDGSHHFSKTIIDHIKAKKRFDIERKRVRRLKK